MAENRSRRLTAALATLVLLAGGAEGRPAGAGARVWAWGGRGFDPPKQAHGSSRFRAQPGGPDPATGERTLEILVDTRETWRGLRALALESPEGTTSARSLRCSKSERHITAASLCVLPGAAVRALPDRGWIVGSDDNGKTVLRERADLRPLRALMGR